MARVKKHGLMHLAAVIATVIALFLSAPAHSGPVITTSLQVPLAGTVFVPLNNSGLDTVNLTGYVHVQTQFPKFPTDPIRIYVNLDQVAGYGDFTGTLYVATGANRILSFFPQDPVNLSFELRAVGAPPDPIQPSDPIMPLEAQQAKKVLRIGCLVGGNPTLAPTGLGTDLRRRHENDFYSIAHYLCFSAFGVCGR
jgi:hypothetical protein